MMFVIGEGVTLSPKRILVISNLFPPQELGGYGRSIADFASGLTARGHTIQVLTSDAPYLGKIHGKELGVERTLELYGTYEDGTRVLEDAHQIQSIIQHNFQVLQRAIATFQPDICLVGNIAFLGSALFLPLLNRNIPVIHHLGFAIPPYSLTEYPNHPLYHLAVASDYVRDRLLEHQFPVQDSITVYPSALVQEFYQPTLPPRDRLRIGYAGLVIHSKGVHVLIDALYYLKQQGIDFECSIAGDAIYSDYKQSLDEGIERGELMEQVKFVGLLNREQLIEFHQQHNVLVFPSIAEEAFGITQVEGMAAGLTLITSGVGGAGEVIEPNISGLQVPPEDSVTLAQALAHLVQNPAHWENLARQGQRRALEKFDIQHSVAQLELQFHRLLEKKATLMASTSTMAVPPYPPSSRFMTWLIDQLKSCLNVYQHSPQDESTIAILREMRKQVTQFWLSAPGDVLDSIYSSPLGVAYQSFLHSNFQNVPLTADEQQVLAGLTQTVKEGVEKPGGVNALLGAMLYFPADKMQVRDAETRLPQWLLSDYQRRFQGTAAVAPPVPETAPAAPSTPAAAMGQPLWNAEFLNRLVGCANLYAINPTDTNIVNRCREARQELASLWLKVPSEHLANVYQGNLGKHYLAFLKSGFQREPLLEPEQSCLKELSDAVKQGFDSPHGLQALLGAMLYLPPGKMQVRDAATRLPAWLLADYQQIFEGEGVIGSPPQPSAVGPAPVHISTTPTGLPQDTAFLNRLLGCLNLYEIDPSDQDIIENLRQLRQQIAQVWLGMDAKALESAFSNEFGQRYCTFLKSGFQREPLTSDESAFRQQLSAQVSTGVESLPGLQALLGAMLYFEPGSMKVSNADQRLPQWLLPYYKEVFEG